MKKYRFKFVALLVAVALMLPNFTGAGALEDDYADNEIANITQVLEEQVPAMDAYEAIISSWAGEHEGLRYPNSFGGFYIDDSNRLVIRLLDIEDTALQESLLAIVNDANIVKFEKATISLNELIDIQYSVEEFYSELNILGTGLDIINEQVVITAEAVDGGILYRSHPHIRVEFGDCNFSPNAAPICNTGNLVMSSSSAGINTSGAVYGTLGCFGSYYFDGGRKPCFVTAGHVIYDFYYYKKPMYVVVKDDKGKETSRVSVISGYKDYCNESECVAVSGSRLSQSTVQSGTSSGDYAFVAYDKNKLSADSDIQVGNAVATVKGYFGQAFYNPASGEYDIDVKDYGMASFPQNTTVMKGEGVSGFSTGRVYSTNCTSAGAYTSSSGSNYNIEHTIKVYHTFGGQNDLFSNPGDSGGPVYYQSSSGHVLTGFVTGTETIKSNGTSRYYGHITPITILLADGFIPYPWCETY